MLGTKILEERESEYNGHLRVVRTLGLGTYIQANGLTQSGGVVESIWKSTLKRMASRKKQIIEKALILGLGGGTVAKLMKKFWPKAKITGIEIDPLMIELGKKYLGLEVDKLVIGDARKFKLGEYDLVVVDSYFGDKYIDLLNEDLKKSKIVIFNRLYYGDKRSEAVKFGLKLQKIFSRVEYYYPEANLMLICYNS